MAVQFITTDRTVAAMLRESGFAVAGTLDDQVAQNAYYVAYVDRKMRSVGEYVARKRCWNVRFWNERGVFSMGWFGSPEAAVRGAERTEALAHELGFR